MNSKEQECNRINDLAVNRHRRLTPNPLKRRAFLPAFFRLLVAPDSQPLDAFHGIGPADEMALILVMGILLGDHVPRPHLGHEERIPDIERSPRILFRPTLPTRIDGHRNALIDRVLADLYLSRPLGCLVLAFGLAFVVGVDIEPVFLNLTIPCHRVALSVGVCRPDQMNIGNLVYLCKRFFHLKNVVFQ